MKISITKTIIVQSGLKRPYILDIQNADLPISDFRIVVRNGNSVQKRCALVMQNLYGTTYGTLNVPSDSNFTLVVNPTEELGENEFDVTSSLLTVVTQWLNGELGEAVCFMFQDLEEIATDSSNTLVLENNAPIVTSIAVTTLPNRTTFYTDLDHFTSSGIVVTATYNNGHTAEISNYRITDPNLNTPGTKSVIISYTENHVTRTTSYEIEVVLLIPVSLSVDEGNDEFNVGDQFTPKTTVVTYNSGAHRSVTNQSVYSGYDMQSVGYQIVTVSFTYNDVTVTTSYQILVKPLSVSVPLVSSITFSTVNINSWQFTVTNPNNFPCQVVIWYSSEEPIVLSINSNSSLLVNESNAGSLTASIQAWNSYELSEDVYCYLLWNGDIGSNNVIIIEENSSIIAPRIIRCEYRSEPSDPYTAIYEFVVENPNPYEVKLHFQSDSHFGRYPVIDMNAHEITTFSSYGLNDPMISETFNRIVSGRTSYFECWFELEVPIEGGGTEVIKTSTESVIASL